jgi:hypothetical protein
MASVGVRGCAFTRGKRGACGGAENASGVAVVKWCSRRRLRKGVTELMPNAEAGQMRRHVDSCGSVAGL